MGGRPEECGDRPRLAEPDADARAIFGARLPLAEAYARRLAGDGIVLGLLGPREVERIWSRHLGNSALVANLFPADARVVDVGSGAGLPGIPLALARPDLRLRLLEPALRRSRFLESVVAELGLAEQISVVRGRAEDPAVVERLGHSSWVVARAVAPLDRLVKWCLPLLAPGGHLVAVKGASATAELAAAAPVLAQFGGVAEGVRTFGGDSAAAVTVVLVRKRADRAGNRVERRRRR
jgi:16S rRNA (guanine527-N7)-methyltransferase